MNDSEKKQKLSDLPNDFLNKNDENISPSDEGFSWIDDVNVNSNSKDDELTPFDFFLREYKGLDYEHFTNLYKQYKTITIIEQVLDFWQVNDLKYLTYSINHRTKKVETWSPTKRVFGAGFENFHNGKAYPNNLLQNMPNVDLMFLPIQKETILWGKSFNLSSEILDFEDFLVEYSRTIQISPLPHEKVKHSLEQIELLINWNLKDRLDFQELQAKLFTSGYRDCVQGKVDLEHLIEVLIDIPLFKDVNDLKLGVARYWDGINTAKIKSFLLEQQKRLERGEDIRYPANMEIEKPVKSEGLKLTWNYENAVLYDIFAQLSLMTTSKNQSVIGNSIEHIAQWINENFEGFPSATTIERQLQLMREKGGNNRPKRNQITIQVERS